MIKSMTGFGRSTLEKDGREYQIEIKSVNHRYNDVNIKIPKNISYLEEVVKKCITSKIKRGKVDVFITFENNSESGKQIKINKELAKIYIDNLKELAEEEKILANIEVTDISKLPDVLTVKNVIEDKTIEEELVYVVNEAVDSLCNMRKVEGEKISEDLLNRINNVEIKILEISKLSTGLIEEYVVKLEERIKELLKTTDIEIDKNRLAQEVVIYADKCSVEEEITRLKSHVDQFRKLIATDFAVGKKLDFIIQEMNRETNTIGSKSNNMEITNRVIDIKTELEDIREQVQNIE